MTSLGGESAELDQPRLVWVQLQREPREPDVKIREEPLGVVPVLKAHDIVVREPRQPPIPARVSHSPLVGPQVEGVVQVNVCKQRRNSTPLARSLLRL